MYKDQDRYLIFKCLIPSFGTIAGDVLETKPAALLYSSDGCLGLSALAPSSCQLQHPPFPAFLAGFYGMGRTLQPLVAMMSLPVLRCMTVWLTFSYKCLCASSVHAKPKAFLVTGVPALSFPLP